LPDTIIKRIAINNLLHKDGTVSYYPNVLTHDDANRYFDLLLQKIVWENDEVIIRMITILMMELTVKFAREIFER
jgi:hypothetical protein